MKHFKIGVTCALDAPAGCPFPLVDPDIYATMDWLEENHFDSIELHLRRPQEVDGVRIREHCARRNLIVSSIGTGMAYGKEGLSLTHPDAGVRRRAVQRLKEQLDLAAVLGCCIVIGSMRGEIHPPETFASVNARMLEATKELCDYAEKVEAGIVVEAIDRFETTYLRTAEEVLELIDQVGSERLQVHLDTYHMNMEERDWKTPILQCGRRLGHMHLADNTRNYPGWGLIDFLPILEALDEIDYDQTLTLECYPFPDGKTAALRGLAHIRALSGQPLDPAAPLCPRTQRIR